MNRALIRTAIRTLVRMAKKTREFTFQVLPKSSAKVVRAFTSRRAKATPKKNMCQSNWRSVLRGATRKIAASEMPRIIARPRR